MKSPAKLFTPITAVFLFVVSFAFAQNINPQVKNVDGTGLEQITFNPTFDSFPMFSPDGRKLAFASNRNDRVKGETNVFIADWVE
jgi:Tol biopolymer transport system component